MPPPLPSIPSSSTPFPGPTESSPASQSPTAPASSEPHNKLSLVAGQMRKSGKKQQCMSQEIWEGWQKAWEDPAFKRKCEIFARNRCNETGDDGLDYSAEEISALQARVDEQERQLVELKAHVMRMSGHHDGDAMTHPAAETTINPVDTTLDRLEDRHHRFDFRSF
ncbi:hypothetical protein JCGZ_18601 [Jatropha curcas]|uniref:Uncharacterized protein n=1 Tax=Jatropha curcas TaxID=180498 RepID=A0A067KCQ8_JATCU|nr:hypothetical protein JCGZ_18601 [Jatropha curcas]